MQNIQFVSASMTISLNDNLTNTKTMLHLGKKKETENVPQLLWDCSVLQRQMLWNQSTLLPPRRFVIPHPKAVPGEGDVQIFRQLRRRRSSIPNIQFSHTVFLSGKWHAALYWGEQRTREDGGQRSNDGAWKVEYRSRTTDSWESVVLMWGLSV